MTSFKRTTSGLIAKYLFYTEPLIWVEGDTDIPFYEQILRNYSHRLEAADGKEECLKLVKALIEKDHPYVVILDGDYDILERTRSSHRRVVLLHRHSIENYLFEKEPIEHICCDYASVGRGENLLEGTFETLLKSLESELMDLVILGVAHHLAKTGCKVLPDKVESLLRSVKSLTFARGQIESLCTEYRNNIDQTSIDKATLLLKRFWERKRFVDILRGHFIFSILRNLIINTVRHEIGRINIDNKGLIIMLSAEVWSIIPSLEHESLRRRLCRAVVEVRKEREN